MVVLALISLFALGYTRLEGEVLRHGTVSAILPPALAQGPPRLPEAAERTSPEKAPTREKAGTDREKAGTDREKARKETRVVSLLAGTETCDDERVLVDRSHTLPPDYVPEDLVSLSGKGVPTLDTREMLLRREAAEHLKELVSAAAVDGEELLVASAFRSYAHQRVSHDRLKSIYGAGADALSATPGHSQHQLGTAVDFTNTAADYQLKRGFGYTSASRWLREHAADHGFVLAYPPGGDESGYEWEPWHYRYLGARNAERLDKSGLTLQAFLVREGVKPRC